MRQYLYIISSDVFNFLQEISVLDLNLLSLSCRSDAFSHSLISEVPLLTYSQHFGCLHDLRLSSACPKKINTPWSQ